MALGSGALWCQRTVSRLLPVRLGAWWALLPGFGLLALGAATLSSGAASGPLFLGFLGAGFAAAYRAERRRWWTILTAGVLWTLALVSWLGETRPGSQVGWVFFLGLAATFGALFSLPGAQWQRWALYPALGTLVVFVVSGAAARCSPSC